MNKNKENKVIIDDNDVRFGVGLYKFIITLVGIIIVIVFSYNTVQVGSVGYKIYKNWNNTEELEKMAIELRVDNEVYKELDYEDYKKEDFTKEDSLLVPKHIVIETYVKIIILEVYLFFLLLYYLNLYNFLENKNLVNPFTKESVSFLSSSIKFGFVAFILSVFLGEIPITVSYGALLILFLIRYIIRKGNEMME